MYQDTDAASTSEAYQRVTYSQQHLGQQHVGQQHFQAPPHGYQPYGQYQTPPGQQDRRSYAPNNQQDRQTPVDQQPKPSGWNNTNYSIHQPSMFVPAFDPPQLMRENDIASILVGPPPTHLRSDLAPITSIPESGSAEEMQMFKDVSLHVSQLSDAMKADIIAERQPTNLKRNEDLILLNLALTVFRFPRDASPTVPLLALVIKRMVTQFRVWWRDARIEVNFEVREMKVQAMMMLSKNNKNPSPQTKWLYALLRTAGHLPELWDVDNAAGGPQDQTSDASGSHNASAMQVDPPAPQLGSTATTASRGPRSSFNVHNFHRDRPTSSHPPSPSGASQSRGQGIQTSFSHHGRAHSSIAEASVQGTLKHSLLGPGSATSSNPPSWQAFNDSTHFTNYREGSNVSLATISTTSTTSHTSNLRAQPEESEFAKVIQYETLRLLQMICLRDKARDVLEMFYRSLYTEVSCRFTNCRLSPTYAIHIRDNPGLMNEIAREMADRLGRERNMLFKLQ